MPVKVLIADELSPAAVEIFKKRGIEVDVKTGLSHDELKAIIGNYDGLAVRSATKPNAEIIEAAHNLKVIGRAGIGVDNIDQVAATARGVVVMNTPFGNSVTTAEHALAMMFSLARQIPQANASTHAGKWEKSKFMGVELTAKTLGVIGCGNIGSIVADRAIGLNMKVIAFDPFLSAERAIDLGVEKVELDDLLKRSDFITLHVPVTDQTRNIIDAKALDKMKPGVRIINCARGGLIDEVALKAALEAGHVAGAALDVFLQEPAKENPLFGMENVVCTPHLGASTDEAQENVALQVAEQISDYLLDGAIVNALNMPSVSAEDAKRLGPYMQLAEELGSFAGQITESGLKSVRITYAGAAAEVNVKPLTQIILKSLLQPLLASVNMVNAPVLAKERDIAVTESRTETVEDYQTLVTIEVETDRRKRSISGSLMAGDRPRIVEIEGVSIETSVTPNMLFVRNNDKPGFIGNLGRTLGDANINIASFDLGRRDAGDEAICVVSVDQRIDEGLLKRIVELPNVVQARVLAF
ncbi:MAG TPA: phosphoglycerate dehydrogenase [Rhodospirillaceae bacterium]|nr:phosphoglycerate dehydrogenase [Alphaproteobacteria bacterium]OUT39617.1 MAG: phosphoglycerate dehydrogenase [Micavibrio sp. TMED2]HCI46396.1 phosphoglycerate dehydrogenase [Rhodospirillaceae bacterium]MAS49010.1 phosphoglycerate dehydrogenase [Alphaproteobacteria bacterium]MAX97388.1 phosphoglycerate dehydrogenase [Alphaproteobacteria bacterium]